MSFKNGSLTNMSNNISIFSMMNRPFARAMPVPRLNTKARWLNCGKPLARDGFLLKNIFNNDSS